MNASPHASDGSEIDADVAVVGGGIVGLAMALTLGGPATGCGLSVALFDRRPLEAWQGQPFDGRASAITATSRALLQRLDVWREISDQAQPIADIVVTDSRLDDADRPSLLHFDTARTADGAAAHMVQNRHLGAALARAVAQAPGIAVLAPAAAEVSFAAGQRARVASGDGRTVCAGVVVAADGQNSALRRQAGIETVGWSYPQDGIVTTVAHERPHRGVAEEHFLPAGPFAILPLTGDRSSLVWTEARDEAKRIMALDDDGFAAELKRRFGDQLGAVSIVGGRWSYPLSMFLARAYVADRLALIGDAAHAIHPIAGLGLNLGLRDVAVLAETLVDAARLGLDIGSPAVLAEYEQRRRPDNVATALATDGLNRLFSNDNAALRAVRDLGLGVVDRIDPLKRLFIKEAAGAERALPRLMRGEAL